MIKLMLITYNLISLILITYILFTLFYDFDFDQFDNYSLNLDHFDCDQLISITLNFITLKIRLAQLG